MDQSHDFQPVVRTPEEEREYHLRRAAEHQQMAESADENGSKKIHDRLRQLYEERAAGFGIVQPD
jgi:hypothetical protein